MSDQTIALQKLDVLVGTWNTEGEVLATATTPAISVKGTDTYEWVCDGNFILHRADVMMGEERAEVIELVGFDPSAGNYPMRSFDNQGNFTAMYSSVDDNGVWKLRGEGMRSTLRISRDGTQMKAHWEKSSDGSDWQPWMYLVFTRNS